MYTDTNEKKHSDFCDKVIIVIKMCYSSVGLKTSFFCFEDFTFRTVPGVRNILSCCTKLYTLLGISFQGIVDVMAFETFASYHLFWLFHCHFNSKKIA